MTPVPIRLPLLVDATFAGSALMALTSWRIGGVPMSWHRGGLVSHAVFYLGLALFTASWLLLGRLVVTSLAPVRLVQAQIVAGVVPFAFAAPFGRDLWAYAAQGNLVRHGVDAYAHGPSAVPGAFTDQVSTRWIGSSTPYGPLWLQVSHFGAVISGGHPLVAALLLRLPALLGVGLWLWAVPVLATRLDLSSRASAGLWLGLGGPLTVVLGVGGGHNDVLMLGLMLAGLAVASGTGMRALAVGAAIAGLAVMVKSPAAVGVAFTVPVWLHASRLELTWRRVITATAVAVVAAGAVVVAVTLACGLGTGWISQVNADAPWVSWLSLPTAAGMVGRWVWGRSRIRVLDRPTRALRTVGEALSGVIVVALWLIALRRAPLACLAVALAAAALLAPSVQPWYYCWGLAVAGLVAARRIVVIALAVVPVAFAVMIAPSGLGRESDWAALPILAAAVVVVWLSLRDWSRVDATGEPTQSAAALR